MIVARIQRGRPSEDVGGLPMERCEPSGRAVHELVGIRPSQDHLPEQGVSHAQEDLLGRILEPSAAGLQDADGLTHLGLGFLQVIALEEEAGPFHAGFRESGLDPQDRGEGSERLLCPAVAHEGAGLEEATFKGPQGGLGFGHEIGRVGHGCSAGTG